MVIIWRGRGLFAAAALALPLAVCAFHEDLRPGLTPILAGLGLAVTGAGCWAGGRRWNRGAVRHTLYFIPLQYWGLAYVALGALTIVAAAGGLLRQGA